MFDPDSLNHLNIVLCESYYRLIRELIDKHGIKFKKAKLVYRQARTSPQKALELVIKKLDPKRLKSLIEYIVDVHEREQERVKFGKEFPELSLETTIE